MGWRYRGARSHMTARPGFFRFLALFTMTKRHEILDSYSHIRNVKHTDLQGPCPEKVRTFKSLP